MKLIVTSCKAVLAFTLITGGAYPFVLWLSGQFLFSYQANGSLVYKNEKVIGSELLAQKTISNQQLHPRPSSSDYATVPSGGTNAYFTDSQLIKRIKQPSPLGEDVTQSASGLDPHLNLENALGQLERISQTRHWTPLQRKRAEEWIATHTQGGIICPAYINVFMFNLALENLDKPQ